MKYLKKFNESIEDDFFNEVFKHIEDLCIEFGDLGLDYEVKQISKSKARRWWPDSENNSALSHTILIEITDTSYGFQIDRKIFNNIVKSIKDYSVSEGCNFFVSRYDEHDSYYLNDSGYTTFEDYLKDQGNFYGFEIRIF